MVEITHRDTGAVIRAVNEASLAGAALAWANLPGADLFKANLSRADLSGANLIEANLGEANLSWANLCGADLVEVNLRGANLSRAILTSALLYRADFSGSNLAEADLTKIRADFFAVLSLARNEIAGLRLAVVEGRIDGSSYEGPCACLIGTIAVLQARDYRNVPGILINTVRPAERFFTGISGGDTPETNLVSAIVLGWIDEFTALPTAQ